MTLRSAVLALAVLAASAAASPAQEKAAPAPDRYDDVVARNAWWREARFGMFIHFGAYAVPARGEWVQSNERLSVEQYRPYVESFRPVDFDARAWARLARAAGMKYAVMTAKHHDGFCLFDSALTDYKIGPRFGGRDLVREYLDAFRAEGLRVGLYYSLIDWHHPDYPNVGNHPMRGDAEYGKTPRQWDRYLAYMHGQVEELVTRYGRLDVLWLDYSFDDYRGEKWGADRLVAMVRRHQPGILLNNRLGVSTGSRARRATSARGATSRRRSRGSPSRDSSTAAAGRCRGRRASPSTTTGATTPATTSGNRRSSWSTRWWRR